MKLLPLQDLAEEDFPFVCDPVHARFWVNNAFRDYVRIEGFDEHLENCEWEACQLEGDPDHWNGRLLGYERLLAYSTRGSPVLVMEPGDFPLHPMDRTFVQKTDERWEPDPDNIGEPEIRARLAYHVEQLHHERQERERHTANHPSAREPEYLPATGPGFQKATLGPNEGIETNRPNVVSQTSVPKGFDDVYAKAPMAKKEIDLIADGIASNAGGTVAKAPIKSRERAIEKINGDYGGDPSKIKDLARNTIVVPPDKIDSVAAQLKARGADVKVINGAENPLGYSGVNATLMTKAGIPAEIQVNSPAMIYAKESERNARSILGNSAYTQISSKAGMSGGKGHQIYEQWRVLKSDSSEAKILAEQSRSYYDAIRRTTWQ